MKRTLSTLTQILSVCLAIAALVCTIVGLVGYLGDLARKNSHYTEFPPEYDDYADWETE
jgi:hypothetical protein